MSSSIKFKSKVSGVSFNPTLYVEVERDPKKDCRLKYLPKEFNNMSGKSLAYIVKLKQGGREDRFLHFSSPSDETQPIEKVAVEALESICMMGLQGLCSYDEFKETLPDSSREQAADYMYRKCTQTRKKLYRFMTDEQMKEVHYLALRDSPTLLSL